MGNVMEITIDFQEKYMTLDYLNLLGNVRCRVVGKN